MTKRNFVTDEEMTLINLTRKSALIGMAIEDIKTDTKAYLNSKGFSTYEWEGLHKYPEDKHQKWVVCQMEKQIRDKELEKELIDAKIVNWLKRNNNF